MEATTTATNNIIRNTEGLIECYLPGAFVAAHDEFGVARGFLTQTYVPGDAVVMLDGVMGENDYGDPVGPFTETITNPFLVCEAAR